MRLNEGLEELGSSAFSGSAIENITLPSTLKKIGYNTFRNCKNLKRVEIPNGVESIGKDCFWDSGIKEISLPATLREIGEKAFD